MTALCLAGAGEAAEFAAFLARLLRWDRAAVVRLRAAGPALAVFGRPPFGPVLAVRTLELSQPAQLDTTVSAGQLLDGIDEDAATGAVPPGVTGPSWAGLLPPRGGWQRVADLDAASLREAAAGVIAEFRARSETPAADHRTRAELDVLAEELWSRPFSGTALPLRAVHAAHALGFLRPLPVPLSVSVAGPPASADAQAGASAERPALLAAGPWLRLRTAFGSVVIRSGGGAGPGAGLGLSVTLTG